jgi:hypothetical protein
VRGFVAVGRHYVAMLDAVERRILAAAVADTAELLGVRLQESSGTEPAEGTGPDDPLTGLTWGSAEPSVPSDPAVARLLPAASRVDDELATEFRRLTDADLRRTKVGNLRLVWTGLRRRPGSLPVLRDDAPRWAAALSDVRLVLATRLGIETDEDAENVYGLAAGEGHGGPAGDEDSPAGELRQAMATLYAVLTWLQESLVTALLDDQPG